MTYGLLAYKLYKLGDGWPQACRSIQRSQPINCRSGVPWVHGTAPGLFNTEEMVLWCWQELLKAARFTFPLIIAKPLSSGRKHYIKYKVSQTQNNINSNRIRSDHNINSYRIRSDHSQFSAHSSSLHLWNPMRSTALIPISWMGKLKPPGEEKRAGSFFFLIWFSIYLDRT